MERWTEYFSELLNKREGRRVDQTEQETHSNQNMVEMPSIM